MKDFDRDGLLAEFRRKVSKDNALCEALFSMIPHGILEKVVLHPKELERVGERRIVTALFADISGFTPLCELFEAEQVLKIVNDLFTRLLAVVARYDGIVDKFMGDAMMVVFGAPKAHEDDPRRAVEAALDMQKITKSFQINFENKATLPRINLSIGINTGNVVSGLVGSETHREYTILGDAVNIAARLESLAAPGQIIVGEETYKHIGRFFHTSSKGSVKLKGKAESQKYYTVHGRKESNKIIPSSRLKPLFGKDKLFSRIKKILSNELPPESNLIIAESGFGKTLTVNHCISHARRTGYDVLMTSALPWGKNLRYSMLSELIRQTLGCVDVKIKPSALEKKVSELCPKMMQYLPLLGDFLSVDIPPNEVVKYMEPGQKREKLEALLSSILANFTNLKKTLLVFEDVSNADEGSLNVIEEISKKIDAPMLLTARPEIFEDWEIPGSIRVREIPNLSEKNASAFLRYLLSVNRAPKSLTDFILEKTNGNPYYIEQLTDYLLKASKIKYKKKSVYLDDVDTEALPSDIFNLLVTHVDSLAPSQRELIQKIAVIGANIPLKILEKLEPEHSSISDLVNIGIIVENEVAGEVRYNFQSPLFKQAAYSLLLSDTQRKLHAEIGIAFEKEYKKNLYDYYEVLSYHFQKGNELSKAFDYLRLAGDKQAGLFANREALHFYERAEKVGKEILDRENIERDFFEVLASEGRLYWFAGELDTAIEKNRQASNIATQIDDMSLLADTLNNIAMLYNVKGVMDKSLELHESALAIRRKTKDKAKITQSLMNIGVLNADQGKLDEAISYYEKALKIVKGTAVSGQTAQLYSNLGFVYLGKGKLDTSLKFYTRALKIDEKLGLSRGTAINYINIANIYNERGDFAKMEEYLLNALDIFKRVGDIRAITLTLNNLGESLREQGKENEALTMHKKALRSAKEQCDVQNQIDASRNIGLDLLELKNYKRACKYLRESVKLADQHSDWEGLLEGYYALLKYFKIKGDNENFQEVLRLAKGISKKYNPLFIKKINSIT
ncbi:tetratricopeptide repeat protein [bacterium]|nr:tetratricopeptide repeat protein [bacterium]